MVGSARTGSKGVDSSSSPLLLEDLLPIIPSSFRFSSSLLCSKLGASSDAAAVEDRRREGPAAAIANDVVIAEEGGTNASAEPTPDAERSRTARATRSFIFSSASYWRTVLYLASNTSAESDFTAILHSRFSLLVASSSTDS